MTAHAKIKVDELPPRARGLAPAETSRVFGGCIDLVIVKTGWGNGALCSSDSECCEPLKCKLSSVWLFGANLKACKP